jgi:hypothetical protein
LFVDKLVIVWLHGSVFQFLSILLVEVSKFLKVWKRGISTMQQRRSSNFDEMFVLIEIPEELEVWVVLLFSLGCPLVPIDNWECYCRRRVVDLPRNQAIIA